MPTCDLTYLLRSVPLIERGSDVLLHALIKDAHIQTIKKRQIITAIDEEASRFFLVKSGWVKLYRETLDGAEAIIDILTSGHLFGETSLFHDLRYPFNAEACEPCEVLSLPLSALRAEIETNPAFAMAMMSSMAHYRRHLDMELEHRTLQSAPQRIGCFLLRLADQSAEGGVVIHLPYDKSLLAARLGMKPETFSRALAKLRADTSITVKGATIQIGDLQQLAKYACAACSSEYPCRDTVHAVRSVAV